MNPPPPQLLRQPERNRQQALESLLLSDLEPDLNHTICDWEDEARIGNQARKLSAGIEVH